MIKNIYSCYFIIFIFKIIFEIFVYEITKNDNECLINISGKYFIITTIWVVPLILLKIPVCIIIQFIILFFLSYMDYKQKEVYSLIIIIFFMLSIVIGLKNQDNIYYGFGVGIGLWLLSCIKIYAKADGVVMFGIFQGFVLSFKENFIAIIMLFFCVQCILCIRGMFSYVCKKGDLEWSYSQALIPLITIISYLFYLLSKI